MSEKIWIVFTDYGYEGCSEPRGAYSSEELAKIAASGDHFYSLEILALEIDKPLQ